MKLVYALLLACLLVACASTDDFALSDDSDKTGEKGLELHVPPLESQLGPEEGNMLTWSQADMDQRFKAMETIYTGHFIKAGDKAKALLPGASLPVDEQRISDYMAEMKTAGIIMVKDGKVILERYARGHTPEHRYTSFSMAKSFMALLLGAAIKDGLIDSVQDPMEKYLPELVGSAYEGVTIEQALVMLSGVKWSEDYTSSDSDVASMLAAPPPEGEDSTISYMRRLPRAVEAGKVWNYSTGESHLLGVLVARVTGKRMAEYLSEKVWVPYGMEDDAFWMVDWSQNDLGGCCISSRLRDYARFGMFMLDDAKEILNDDYYTNMISRKSDVPGYPEVGYGYQWWTYPEGRFGAQGLYGQNIIIDPNHNIVMVVSSALKESHDPKLSERRFAYIGELFERAKSL